MTATPAATALNVGFLSILQDAGGFAGGYLVTNNWGRPLEFRLSTAVQPSRIHEILYGKTLRPYVCAELIGKTLIEKAATEVQVVFTDNEAALDLRRGLQIPTGWVSGTAVPHPTMAGDGDAVVRRAEQDRHAVYRHRHYPSDTGLLRDFLMRLENAIDLSEPFARIREAMGEARKMGVTARG